MIEDITFENNKTLIGTFELDTLGMCTGKLVYERNNSLVFYIYPIEQVFEQEITQDVIYARLADNKENLYSVTLLKSTLHLNHFNSAGMVYVGNSESIIFSKNRSFDPQQDNLNHINVYLRNWDEFCFPQGYKSRAEYQSKMMEFRLNNHIKVSFNQDISGNIIRKDNIFNSLFINFGLSEDEVANIETALNRVLIPHRHNLGIKKPENHKWFVTFENIPKKYDIDIITYIFGTFFKCLTYDFSSEVNQIEVKSVTTIDKKTYPITFDYLYHRYFVDKNLKYTHSKDAFTFNSFSQEEWKSMLNKLFANLGIIEPIFDILYKNHLEYTLSEYHLERYIDCISAAGIAKGNDNSLKYEGMLLDVIKDIDKELSKNVLSAFKSSLKNIKLTQKQKTYNKKNWGLIGIKLSQLRALTTHFQENGKRIEMTKYLKLYFLLELFIIDYIFELIEMEKGKRKFYKEHYMKDVLRRY